MWRERPGAPKKEEKKNEELEVKKNPL